MNNVKRKKAVASANGVAEIKLPATAGQFPAQASGSKPEKDVAPAAPANPPS
jgi:hypothetical protein